MLKPFVWLWGRIQAEPVAAQAVVQSGIALGTAFDLHWNADQIAVTLAFSASVLAFLTRTAVTANVSLPPAP